MQPPLTTARLILRPAAPADVDELHALWTHPDVRRYLWDDRIIDRALAESTLADCLGLASDGLGLWICERTDHADPAFVGCAGLLPVSTAADYDETLAGMIEPLVALAPAHWGRGYAQEALRALLAYAEHTLGVNRLAAVTDVPNEASDRMLRRAGFHPLREAGGPRYPLRVYAWQAGGQRSD
jgi:RimJ/RimL family protein N-acetyltransferase